MTSISTYVRYLMSKAPVAVKNALTKLLFGLSLLVNLLIVCIVIGLANGQLPGVRSKLMVESNYDRWLRRYEMLPIRSGDVVFLGDSITKGGFFHELFPGVAVRNRGIGGDTTSGVLARLDQVARGKPSKVFLLIGTNDVGNGLSDEHIVKNISTIVDRLLDATPETEIFVQSILPRSRAYRESIERLNNKIKMSVEDRASWIDLYPLMLDKDGSIANRYSKDELHLADEAYLLWADVISDHLP